MATKGLDNVGSRKRKRQTSRKLEVDAKVEVIRFRYWDFWGFLEIKSTITNCCILVFGVIGFLCLHLFLCLVLIILAFWSLFMIGYLIV